MRKLADRSDGEERVTRFDPETGQKFLACPKTGEPKPYPFAGLAIEGDAPQLTRLPTTFVNRGIQEGWIEVENQQVWYRPSGPAATSWSTPPHAFMHCDVIVLKTVDGDVRYRVTHQPDKYVDERTFEPHDRETPLVDPENDVALVTDGHYAAGQTAVHWFYDVELEA